MKGQLETLEPITNVLLNIEIEENDTSIHLINEYLPCKHGTGGVR